MPLVRAQYKTAIATAISELLRDELADVSVVKFDPFWDRPAKLAQLETRLPAVCVRYSSGAQGDDEELPGAVQWDTLFDVIKMSKLDNDDEYQYTDDIDEIEGVFERDDMDSLPGLAAAGLIVKEVRPDSDSMFDDLIDKGIGGVLVTVAVRYSVSPTTTP